MAKEIFRKILEVQKGVLALQKDAQGNSSQYLTGNKLLSVVRPLMDAHGLLLLPEVLEATFTPNEYSTSKGSKKEFFCELKMRFTWVDSESGETLEQLWASTGQTGFDKSIGSALTYGERYYLMKMLHLQTDKDDVDAPKTEEEEATVQSAIANINACTDAGTAMQWLEYYKQFPKIGRDKDFLKAYNKKMQELNGKAEQQQ